MPVTLQYAPDSGDDLTIEIGVPVSTQRLRMSAKGLTYQRGRGKWLLIEWDDLEGVFDQEGKHGEWEAQG